MSNTVKVDPLLQKHLEDGIPPRLDEGGKPVRCLLLYSGGLDSTLAGALLRLQGIDVVALNMSTGFCLTSHKRAMGKTRPDGTPYRNEAIVGAAGLRIPVDVIDVSEGYLKVLTEPRYGWGSAVNPCIDCRIHMLEHARELMEEYDAHFVATGEVMGQRPMTQMKKQIDLIERRAGLERLVVRPLCQALMWETIPEKRGWVDRDGLLSIQGRGRKGQIALAKKLGILDFPQPAGGCCFLTDGNYGKRLRDVLDHKAKEDVTFEDVLLLKAGRHFRLPGGSKLVVGRDQDDNELLEGFWTLGLFLHVPGIPGPRALFLGEPEGDDFELAMRITARYSDAPEGEPARVVQQRNRDEVGSAVVIPLPRGDENPWKIL